MYSYIYIYILNYPYLCDTMIPLLEFILIKWIRSLNASFSEIRNDISYITDVTVQYGRTGALRT